MIVVEGKIKAKARPRFNTKTGRAFTPNDTISYENWIRYCYREQCGEMLEGSIKAKIFVYYNIAKIVLDSLNKIAFNDDAQVIELIVIKKWTDEQERIEFELEEVIKN